ncbi:MAG TPA: peptidylprolyl isomerase [Chthoniobacterales bacterium]
MNRILPSALAVTLTFVALPHARALTAKPNVAPVTTSSMGNQSSYINTTQVLDLAQFFKDPDASAAVQVTTSLGAMNFTLDGETTPITVANFLNYVNSGRYFTSDPNNGGEQASLFVHRAVANFVIQTGGFLGTVNPDGSGKILPTQVLTDAAIPNEPHISNKRGTIAMAKLGGDPNSATSQWFINLADNSANLDAQNGGFTVFGRVAGNGMSVADAISKLTIVNAGSPFDSLPVRNYTAGDAIRLPNIVSLPSISQISPLVFSATSSNQSVATVTISGTHLLIKGRTLGTSQIKVTATDLDGLAVSQTFTATITSAPARLTNISSRAQCATGDNVLIGGFIVRGSGNKRLIVRAIGPDLANFGVKNPIADPSFTLHDVNAPFAANDNWGDDPQQQLVNDLGRAPVYPNEAATLTTVAATPDGSKYTAVMVNNQGVNGIGLVEIFDYDSGAGSTLHNISSRGVVGTGDNIMIGGFIISGDGTRRIITRGLGPSLAEAGLSDVLENPVIDLRDVNGNRLSYNEGWQTGPDAEEIKSYKLDPKDPNESALAATLRAGNYTVLLSGMGIRPTGQALLEIYDGP